MSESSGESTATQQSVSDAQEVPQLHIDTTVAQQSKVLPEQLASVLAPLFEQPPEDPPKDLPEDSNPDPIIMTTNPPSNGGEPCVVCPLVSLMEIGVEATLSGMSSGDTSC